VNKAKMAAAILLTMPGTPYLYYGEEIGMVGDKIKVFEDIFGPDAYVREPFIWDMGKNDPMQTAWEKPQFSTDSTVVPISKQRDDENSLYNFYRKLISTRNNSPTLTYGDIDHADIKISEVVSFKRLHEKDQVLVMHNVSDVEITIPLVDGNKDFTEVLYDMNGTAKVAEGELMLPAYTTVILKQTEK
jgi:glycosidase